MNTQERDEIIQKYVDTKKKVKVIKRLFEEVIEDIDEYKTLVINARIDALKVEKEKKWWQK